MSASESTPGSAAAKYQARLDQTIRELQDRVQSHTEALNKLREIATFNPHPSSTPSTRLHQLRLLTIAHTNLTPEPPTLPSPDSPLPSLLALRITSAAITSAHTAIANKSLALSTTQSLLDKEIAELRDARLLTTNLTHRIQTLKAEIAEQAQKPPDQVAREMLAAEQARKHAYQRSTKRLVRAFNDFVDTHLAAMLAAEELGGPVVGELLEVSDEMLKAGFNAQGRTNKATVPTGKEDGMRQKRIDEIWGRLGEGSEDGEVGRSRRNEREAAGAEMRSLTEVLLNTAAEGSGAYVELERDSAAARFLVRARVAQFHPRDAMRLRLIDFGRELDD